MKPLIAFLLTVWLAGGGAAQEQEKPQSQDQSKQEAPAQAPPPAPVETRPKRIRAGGQVMAARLIEQPKPEYPAPARAAGIQGTVKLEAIVGKDGTIQDLKFLAGHPVLVKAALEAVSRWRYKPTLLNGEPVEVITEIDVNVSPSDVTGQSAAQSQDIHPRLKMTPGEAIQQSLQAAVRGRSNGTAQFENLNPDFSAEAPLILSDTQGVDFGPYLARIVYIVRRNWYAEIPESARLGEKGRVAIIFEILKGGSVPQIRVVASSGSDPLDRAAVAGIRDSAHFPPLPQEFTGNHLVLEFIFLYNLGSGRGSGEGSKEARWSGMIVRSDKDASTLTVRKRGTTLEKIVHYDSSTKWTTQEGKEVKPIEMSEVKDGERVICIGSYDEKGEFHATRVDLRKAGGNYAEPTAISRPFPEYTRQARKAKVDGIVAVRFTVDAQGKVSDIQVTKSLGLGLDEKTVEAVSKWKFHPATRDGVPVPAPRSVAFHFGPSYRTPQEDAQAFSAAGFKSAEPAAEAGPTSAPAPQNPPAPAGTGGKDFMTRNSLQHPPEGAYAVGEGVSAPICIYQPMPAYSEEARHAKHQGTVVLWIVVNADGSVSDVRVKERLGMGLDEKAVETVKTWKFRPGMLNGVPVPVLMSVQVLFRLM